MSFKESLNQIVSDGVSSYLERGVDPNITLSKHASFYKLSAKQIDRVVANTNRKIIVSMQKNASKNDPHFVFPVAKTATVIGLIKTPSAKAKPSLPTRKEKAKEVLEKVLPSIKTAKRKSFDRNAWEKQASLIVAQEAERDRLLASLDRAKVELEKVATLAHAAGRIPLVVHDSNSVYQSLKLAHDKLDSRGHKFVQDGEIDEKTREQGSSVVEIELKIASLVKQIRENKCLLKKLAS